MGWVLLSSLRNLLIKSSGKNAKQVRFEAESRWTRDELVRGLNSDLNPYRTYVLCPDPTCNFKNMNLMIRFEVRYEVH